MIREDGGEGGAEYDRSSSICCSCSRSSAAAELAGRGVRKRSRDRSGVEMKGVNGDLLDL
jgi:hypothetical protein